MQYPQINFIPYSFPPYSIYECNASHEANNECLRSRLVVAFCEFTSAKLRNKSD